MTILRRSRKLWGIVFVMSLAIGIIGGGTLFYLFDKPIFEEDNIGITSLPVIIPFAILAAYSLCKARGER